MQREQSVKRLRGEQNRTCAGSGQPSQVGLVLWGAGGTQDSFSGARLYLHPARVSVEETDLRAGPRAARVGVSRPRPRPAL